MKTLAIFSREKTTFNAILLIIGCCIGAGMIGLPVMSALAGFMPSMLAMAISYFFATSTGLLLLEATLWFDKKVNLISLAGFALGKFGKVLTFSLFAFLFYSLFVAYIDGGGLLFSKGLSECFHMPIPREVGVLSLVSLMGFICYQGTQVVSFFNKILLFGLAAAYFTLVFLGLPAVEGANLMSANIKATLLTVPFLLVSFGYQNLVPTIAYYLKRNVKAIRFSILIGNLIPFLIYFVWNFVIIGIIPHGNAEHLEKIVSQSQMVTILLEKASQSKSVVFISQVFSFCAILTSFMANSLTFVDFLKDGFSKRFSFARKRLFLMLLVIVPPTVCSLFYPKLFLKALAFAGGLVDVLLFGILPLTIVCVGRYFKKMKGPYTVMGGKPLLVSIFLVCLGFIIIGNFL